MQNQTEMRLRVGIIGVGRMGRPIGRHLMNAGFEVSLYDPIKEATAELEASGAMVAATPAELAELTDAVFVLVGYPNEAVQSLTGVHGYIASAKPGSVIIIGSTVPPQLVRDVAVEAAKKGVHVLDAPMARGEKGAVEGNLLWFVGGHADVLERCRSVLAASGPDIYHLGGLGAGQVGKTVNNMLLWAALVADHEGFELAESYGVDTGVLREALIHSSANNWAMENWQHMKNIPWAQKDMNIVLEMADQAKKVLPMAGFIREQVKKHMYEAGF